MGIHSQPVAALRDGCLDHSSTGVLLLADQMEFGQCSTVGDTRHRLCHLQRRCQQAALADREVGGVAIKDPAFLVFEHPLVVGNQPGRLADERQTGARSKAKLSRKAEENRRSGLDADLIEPGVARAGDGALHVDVTLGRLRPVVENVVADSDGGRAVNGRILGDHAVVERCESDDRLVGRCRWIGRLKGTAMQWSGGIFIELLELRIVDAGNKAVEVE